ncbi:type II toxin-antitoxin system RelE/ParE family toxin [Psychromonas sp. GE-S-Ul-11]|uniref:type II toxin-antitoxin system RelE/ParE family toxin n=1 Tax=unclassified Psychromonas TaxID=2614957 RepID=UPI00390C41B6
MKVTKEKGTPNRFLIPINPFILNVPFRTYIHALASTPSNILFGVTKMNPLLRKVQRGNKCSHIDTFFILSTPLSNIAFYTLFTYTLFMKCIFVESKIFEKYRDEYLSDEEFRLFQAELMSNPKQGDVIQGTGGLRKIRVGSKGKGKRGGSRIIYYFLDEKRRFYLLTIYGKNEMSDLTVDQKKQLKSFMEVWRNEQS